MTHIKKDFNVQIDRDVFNISERCLTGAQLLTIAGKVPTDQYQLYQKHHGGKVDKVAPDQTVCFDDPGIEKFTTQKKSHTEGTTVKFKIQVDRDVIEAPDRCMSGIQILELAGKIPYSDYQLYQKLKSKVEKVGYEQTVCFDDPGIEKFTTQKKSHTDGADVKFKIQVDKDTMEAPHRCMTGREILELAVKQPYSDFQLYQKLKSNKVEKIDYQETVCFDDPGIERFTTQKKRHQDGEKQRREFQVLPDDLAYLYAMGYVWEAITDTNLNYVILRGLRLPRGYNVSSADVAIRIDNGYPRGQLDMAFYFPPLSRADGVPVNALTEFRLEGKAYQQWSRHRTPENPWVEGVDCLATHIGFALQWLEDEFKRTPNGLSA